MNDIAQLEDTIVEKVEALREQIVEGTRRLVRIPSVKSEAKPGMPFGAGVHEALQYALTISRELGFETVNMDGYMGYAQYGRGEDYVCAIGHVDVVPVGEGWKQPPFLAYVEDDVIYGRGVLDNKGPIISCLYGLATLKELGLTGNYPIRVIFGCDEESGFEDLSYYKEREKPPRYGFTPDCKYPVIYSERGRAIIKIQGNQYSLESFFRFLNTYFLGANNTGDRIGIDFSNAEYGTMEMRGYQLNTEIDSVCFQVTFSYPVGITIQKIIEKIEEKSSPYGLSVCLVHNYDPVVFEKNSPMVKALQESYEKVTALDGTPVTTTGGTYAKAFPGIVPFGPSFPGQKGISHNPNEWMKIEDLITNAKIYALALYKLSMLP